MNFNALNGIGLFGIAGMAVVFTIGCSDLSTPQPIPTDTSTTELHGRQTLTIHVPQMSERLKLLWSDWPNRVKQALSGLDGVESVDDEWDRNPDAIDLEDLLFVTYDADRIDTEQLQNVIQKEGFESVLR